MGNDERSSPSDLKIDVLCELGDGRKLATTW